MLILPIKKKWFDMILSGEKKEEYRGIKPYYMTRFANIGLLNMELKSLNYLESLKYVETDNIRVVGFRNGYNANSPLVLAEVSLYIGTGRTEWGAEPGETYFVLSIHNVYKEDKNAGSN